VRGGGWKFPDGLAPFDDHVGPFPTEEFAVAWLETTGVGSPASVATESAFLPLVVVDGLVSIAGEAELTDYHSPLGPEPDALVPLLMEVRESADAVVLDSLPAGSAAALASGFRDAGVDVTAGEYGATAVITVEGEYLDGLSKKQRHEVRRKYRRFTETVGPPQLVMGEGGDAPMDRFSEMHRQSVGEKGTFLTPKREAFFRRLYTVDGWEIVELRAGKRVAASLFGYRGNDGYYLYNSTYGGDFREASPGAVALYLLIEHLVNSGCRHIDLLKGDEIYKYRMGAELRPLHRISL
jgi:CelD/BcsL family acetyltransferase involved in cellulose biosynthesis